MKMRFRHTACHGRPGRAPSLTPAATSTWACLPEPHHVPQPTRHNGAPCWPDPRTMGRSDPPRKMNARILDSDGWGLIRSRGLWYVPVQTKRPFKIPISDRVRKDHNSPDKRFFRVEIPISTRSIAFHLTFFGKSASLSMSSLEDHTFEI